MHWITNYDEKSLLTGIPLQTALDCTKNGIKETLLLNYYCTYRRNVLSGFCF